MLLEGPAAVAMMLYVACQEVCWLFVDNPDEEP
jgi:hypothetical protein